ncbi:GAF domain-containing sensor histidine kinase [Balneola sp. MJW-20]|uniref:GAF domain-containing sensor histidine kinase n=1 Tax=Gracilimonas aurantiaca TaxID=3234185 RepID=UPI0034659420
MSSAPQHKRELDRLIKLTEMDLDYSDLSKYLDDLTLLAARISGTKISMINLIDTYTQWTISNQGFDVDQMPREESVCQYTLLEEGEMLVEDLSADERFKERSYVTSDPNLRYYLGIPLSNDDGLPVGTLCLMDSEKKSIAPEKVELIKLVAKEVVRRLESLQKMNDLREKIAQLENTQKKLSHDIRGPISGIIGVAEIIEAQGSNNRIEDILELITLVKKGGESVLELAEEIMEQSKAENEDLPPGKNEYSTESFCNKLSELYTPQATAKKIDLHIETGSESASINFPKAKLLQIAGNLISNSIKFTPEEGKVNVNVEIKEEEGRSGDLCLKVSDSGVGISDDKIKEILQGGTGTTQGTTGEKGYGFGLSLVKHLIDKAGGEMSIQSEKGKGTTFKINIPL